MPIKVTSDRLGQSTPMMPTDIFLIVQPGLDIRAAAGVAGELAARFGARLEGLCLMPLPELKPEDCYATGKTAIHELTLRLDQETEILAAADEAIVREAIGSIGEFVWTVVQPGELAAATALRCRLADLVVITRPTPHHTNLAEAVLRLGGAPCLIVPETWDPRRALDHVVVAWNGSRQAKRALEDALPMLREAKTVSVLIVGPSEGCEGRHDALIAHLGRKGVAATLASAPKGPYGQTILDWCAEHQADLLVMGAFGHTPRTERWFGGTTWTALTGARIPVLMSC